MGKQRTGPFRVCCGKVDNPGAEDNPTVVLHDNPGFGTDVSPGIVTEFNPEFGTAEESVNEIDADNAAAWCVNSCDACIVVVIATLFIAWRSPFKTTPPYDSGQLPDSEQGLLKCPGTDSIA